LAIIDVEFSSRAGWTPRDLARAFLNGGARFLQLRAKRLEGRPFLELAAGIVEDAHAANALLVVNDRADIAVLAGASGVHVGQDDLSPADVRRMTGPEAIVGLSTHTRTQIDRALSEPISYFAVGPVFTTATKDTGYDEVGLSLVKIAADAASIGGTPIVAIGGITLATAPRAIEAGAATVAVITDLLSEDPEARVRQYVSGLG
jgi:thiamine-phosphate pyrophosphorylase